MWRKAAGFWQSPGIENKKTDLILIHNITS